MFRVSKSILSRLTTTRGHPRTVYIPTMGKILPPSLCGQVCPTMNGKRSAKPGEMRNLATSCRKIWQRVVKSGEAMKGRHPQTSVSIAVTFEEEKMHN